jgi:hypothetical protein
MAILQNTSFRGTANTLQLPSGTTAQRPATPAEGMIRFNSTIGINEVFMNNAWENIVSPVANTKCYLPLYGTADGDITDTVSGVVGTLSGGTRNYLQSGYNGLLLSNDAYLDIMTTEIRKLDGNPFWTIEFWLYKTGGVGSSAETMVELCHYTRGLLYRASDSDGTNNYWRGGAINLGTTTSNSWVHHAVVGYGANIMVFKNGTQVANTMNGTGVSRFADPITTGGHDLCRIGRSSHTSGQYTNGTFRKFKISNSAKYLANFTSSAVYPL